MQLPSGNVHAVHVASRVGCPKLGAWYQFSQVSFTTLSLSALARPVGRERRLAEAGVRVALVDAGRAHPFVEHQFPFDLKYRNRAPEVIRRTRPRQLECYACTEHNFECDRRDDAL
jgi:hypothetical protein